MVSFLSRLITHTTEQRVDRLRSAFQQAFVRLKPHLVQELRDSDTSSALGEPPATTDSLSLSLTGRVANDLPSLRQKFRNLTDSFRLSHDLSSHKGFCQLVRLARLIEKAPVWEAITDESQNQTVRPGPLAPSPHPLDDLIKFTHYHADVIFEWINSAFMSHRTGEMPIVTQDLYKIVASLQGKLKLPETKHAQVFQHAKDASTTPGKWEKSFDTRVHCELRVIGFCTQKLKIHIFTRLALDSLPIGTSKRCFLCCSLAIDAFNRSSNFNFETRRHKPFHRVALSGVNEPNWKAANDAVCKGVRERAQQAF
ncbi:hypothetical protein DXG01_014993 [Tephrocybe rancida]|nr:hypothetical protein DXG01_014993 [Tephrocybe rancida]